MADEFTIPTAMCDVTPGGLVREQNFTKGVFKDVNMGRVRFDDVNLGDAEFYDVNLRDAKFGDNCAINEGTTFFGLSILDAVAAYDQLHGSGYARLMRMEATRTAAADATREG